MRTVTEHRDAVLALAAPLTSREVPLGEALGLVLAADLVSRLDLPGFDNSAMDGYAVRAADLAGADEDHPVSLPVAGDIAAGDTAEHALEPGSTWRIMTGAPLPRGADAVVPVELSDGGDARAAMRLAPEVGRHVRRRGEDVGLGDIVLTAGQVLTPGRLALAAAANVPVVHCIPRPRVAVVSTGDELVRVGEHPAYGQIVDSNSAMLAALVEAAGAEVASVTHVPDDADRLRDWLRELPGEPDLVLTTGGVSMGAYDTVKEVLREEGGVEFVRVAMRPGMPQGCGAVGDPPVPIITLPGNPVSSFVSFHVFVWPVLRRLAGAPVVAALEDSPEVIETVAAQGWESAADKVELTRVMLGPEGAHPSRGQGSHMLGALGQADALAIVPAEITRVEAGTRVRCLPLLGHA